MVIHEGGSYETMISDSVAASQPEKQESREASPSESWVHRHPHMSGAIALSALLILGAAIVLQRSDVTPANSSGAWGGAGGAFFGTIRSAAPVRNYSDDVMRLQSPDHNYATVPIFNTTPKNNGVDSSEFDDIASLLNLLAAPETIDGEGTTQSPDGYSLIPQGLISVTTNTQKKRTPEQEALYTYGNEVGTYVSGYEDTHRASPQTLKDHIEDRTDPTKTQALYNLGYDMAALGADLLLIPDVPEAMAAAHKAYANTYRIVGTNLTKVSETTTDEEFVAAVATYNTSVEDLTKRFLAVLAVFNAFDVQFAATDPGSMFMFNTSTGF